jgi:hypothetical protein
VERLCGFLIAATFFAPAIEGLLDDTSFLAGLQNCLALVHQCLELTQLRLFQEELRGRLQFVERATANFSSVVLTASSVLIKQNVTNTCATAPHGRGSVRSRAR